MSISDMYNTSDIFKKYSEKEALAGLKEREKLVHFVDIASKLEETLNTQGWKFIEQALIEMGSAEKLVNLSEDKIKEVLPEIRFARDFLNRIRGIVSQTRSAREKLKNT